jgi:hypothetical protein
MDGQTGDPFPVMISRPTRTVLSVLTGCYITLAFEDGVITQVDLERWQAASMIARAPYRLLTRLMRMNQFTVMPTSAHQDQTSFCHHFSEWEG